MNEIFNMALLMLFWRISVFAIGVCCIVWALHSAIRAFVLPRSERVLLQQLVFRTVYLWYRLRLRKAESYLQRDKIVAMYAPIALLLMPIVFLLIIGFGYTLMFWSSGVSPLREAFVLSGSSLFTLGFATAERTDHILLIFSEATIGLGVVALVISYLPTMYGAFSEREKMVAMLEVRAGDPPSAVELLKRFGRLERTESLNAFFAEWEEWFATVEETHTSLPALIFFRSPQPERSWITAAGTVLDSAALYVSAVVDIPTGYRAALSIRAGYIALRRIADFFEIEYDDNPQPGSPISITFEEFSDAYAELLASGLPLQFDLETAWLNFVGWRVNYDTVLIQLANVTMAPYAHWISDRSIVGRKPADKGVFGRIRQNTLG